MVPHRAPALIYLLFALTGSLPGPLRAADDTPAGRLDFDALGLPASATVDLTMGRTQLALLVAASSGDESTAALLAGLEEVHLRQYAAPSAETLDAALALPSRLVADGWVLSRHESQGGKHVYIHARMADGEFEGFTVTVIDPAGLVAVANVVGDIPPAQLGQLGLPLTP